MELSAMVRVVSSSTVKPPPRPRHSIPLTFWDVVMLSTDYIQKGLLFHKPSSPLTFRVGVEIVHAVADGVSIADVIPPDANVPRLVQSFFPLGDAVGFDGHELPLFVVQVTELADGVFVGFVCNHALADGTALWDFLNSWAEIARARLNLATPEGEAPRPLTSRRAPLLERWSADGGAEPQIVLACADLSELLERSEPPPLRPRILHFSAESLALLKERARQELLAAGDTAGAAALTRGSRL
ncbi:hypothetical protein ACQ4PT_058768 [Festuca glaucescens]